MPGSPFSARIAVFVLGSFSIVAPGCKTAGPAEAVRPPQPTYAGVTQSEACRPVEAYGEPLIVDWKPELRGDLEVEMREGVAIVEYNCHTLRMLKDCSAKGSYAFVGMTRKEQLLRFENGDDIRASLPLRGAFIATELSGDMQRGATLDVALVMIGKKSTTSTRVQRGDLKGRCDGATHFIRRATVGAFAMSAGSRAEVASAAQLFGAGLATRSNSQKGTRNQDGDLESCRRATLDAAAPPEQCGAPLRLELVAIEEPQAPQQPPPGAKPADAAADQGCPPGLVVTNGKYGRCWFAHACKEGDALGCANECDRGSAESCYTLAEMMYRGDGVEKSIPKAADTFQRACDAGLMLGCVHVGYACEGSDLDRAERAYKIACDGGHAEGCNEYGRVRWNARKDFTNALAIFRRSCDAGFGIACSNAGGAYRDGVGAASDWLKAAQYWSRGCDGRQGVSCLWLGKAYEEGRGLAKDPAKAAEAYRRGCELHDEEACKKAGR